MHISEGILSAPVLITGALLSAGGTAVGLKKLDYERTPQVAIFSAAFFVASLVHVPVGPSSVHLIMNGLMGCFLGWVSFPAILIGLFLQAILFQFGGITVLGVNTLNMALPAVLCFYLFRAGIISQKSIISIISAFLCGAGGVFFGGIMVAISLVFTGESFKEVAGLIILAHIPVMVVEGIVTVFCVKFLKKVKPEILEDVYA